MQKPIYLVLFLLCFSCSRSNSSPQTNQDIEESTSSSKIHFFSVAWGCVEVATIDLEAADYEIKDYQTSEGKCPDTLQVLEETSEPLFTCDVTIGPSEIDATYVFYNKRTLDKVNVDDLEAQGFTAEVFCPEISKKVFE